MTNLKKYAFALLAASMLIISAHPMMAVAEQPATSTANDAERARQLLERAGEHLRTQGEQAIASFSRTDEFVDGELYIYVIDTDGNFLASSGGSANLIGRNVSELTDSDRYPFIRAILNNASAREHGQVEYRWNNPQRGRIEHKIALWRKIDRHILVIGYYSPHPSMELAKSLLWRAVHALKTSGEDAFGRFNNLNGGYIEDDLYVFVIGLDDGLIHAHGGQPRYIGRNAAEMIDPNGTNIGKEMIAVARDRGEGEVGYIFRNPLSQKNEAKRSYVVRVGKYLVGVGTYADENRR